MRNKLITHFLVVITICLISANAQAALWNMNVGDVFKFDGKDSAAVPTTWQQTVTVIASQTSAEKTYYKVSQFDYENNNKTEDFYIFSDDKIISVSSDGNTWDTFFNIELIGTSFTVGNKKTVTGYDSTFNTYTVENYLVDTNGIQTGGSDKYFVASGKGIVLEVDSWGINNDVAPYIQKRIDWNPPSTSPVPEPATMLLFGTGIAGLAGVARRKKKA